MSGNDKTKDIAQNPSKEETELDWEAPPEPPRPPRPDPPRPNISLKSNEKPLAEAIDKLKEMSGQEGDDQDEDLDEDEGGDEEDDILDEDGDDEPDEESDDGVPYELRFFKENFKKGNGIKVKLVETDVEDSGSFPITWCLDKDVIKSFGYQKMWVLFSVFPPTVGGHNAEWRGYAKVKDMVGYITLLRPGHNRILVRLTWSKEVVKMWMSRYKGRWAHPTIIFPHDEIDMSEVKEGTWTFDCLTKRWADISDYGCVKMCYFDYIDVDMPKDCFAKEPSEAFKNWVNYFYRFKCVDECEFRRRALFAIFVQPFVVLSLILFRLLVCVSLLFFAGLKGLNWRSVTQPLTYTTDSIWEDVDVSYYYIKKLPIPISIFPFFLPIMLVGGLVMVPLLGAFGITLIKWIALSVVSITIAFAIIIPLGLFDKLTSVIEWFFELVEKLNEWSNRRANEERKRRLRELELLASCETANIKTLKDVKNKTIRLRFQGVKSMVCKPFAR